MRKTRLGATILEGHDIADLPLVSENAEILDNAILELENTIGDLDATSITLPDGKTVSQKFTEITTEIGDKGQLNTTDTSNLVAAINELKGAAITELERNKWNQTGVDLDVHKAEKATHSKLGHIKLSDIPSPNIASIEDLRLNGEKELEFYDGIEWKPSDWKYINMDPNSWEGVQNIVRSGLANDYFAVGDQVASNYDGKEIIWEVIGIDVDIPSDRQYTHSMTLQTKDCLYDRAFDPGNDNRYINSPIRTHLNGEFLNKLDPELSSVLGKVDKKVAKRDDLGGGQDSFSDKVFLLSRVEVDLGTEGVTTGEKVYPFYSGVANAARIKNLNGSPRTWWLRSPHVGSSGLVRIVRTSGTVSNSTASHSYGVSPACVII